MPRILAHRGQPEGENTIEAFRAALDAGADIIETDIQCSADGIPVVFHDSTLERIAGLAKAVEHLTLEQLRSLNVGIPTLAEVLAAFPQTKFNIDFKAEKVIEPAVKVIREVKAEHRVLAASFSGSRLARVHQLAPELPRSLPGTNVALIYFFRFLVKPLTRGFIAAQIPPQSGILNLSSPRFVSALKRAGLEVHFWVVNETSEADRLLAIGADGFVTDYAGKLVAHLRNT